MGLSENIQKALSAGYSQDEIWGKLQNHPNIQKAYSAGYDEEKIKKALGLFSIPTAGTETEAGLTSPSPGAAQTPIIDDEKFSPIIPEPWATPQLQQAYGQLIERGHPEQKARAAVVPSFTPEGLRNLASDMYRTPEMRALSAFEGAYVPIKYGIERPFSRAATEDREDTFEGWAKEAGWGKYGAKGIGIGTRILSSIFFWGALGALSNRDPIREIIGTDDAGKLKRAIDSGDFKTVGEFIQSDPKLAQRVFNVDTTTKVLKIIKDQNPEAYKQIYDSLFQARTTPEVPTAYPTQAPVMEEAAKSALLAQTGTGSGATFDPAKISALAEAQLPKPVSPPAPIITPSPQKIDKPLPQYAGPTVREVYQSNMSNIIGGAPPNKPAEAESDIVKRLKSGTYKGMPGYLKTAEQRLGEQREPRIYQGNSKLKNQEWESQEKKAKELAEELGLEKFKPIKKPAQTFEEWMLKGEKAPPSKSMLFSNKGDTKFTSKTHLHEGTSNKVQRKMAHILFKQTNLTQEEYRDIAEELTGVRTTTQMTEDQAQKFLHHLDDRIKEQEDNILKSIFASKEAKNKILLDRNARAEKIGKFLTDPKYDKDVESFKKLADIETVTPDKLKTEGIDKGMIEEFPEMAEATRLRNLRFVRHEFKADKNAWNLYTQFSDAYEKHQDLYIKSVKEAEEMAKGLTTEDLTAIRNFRERTGDAPSTLTPKQKQFNEWMSDKLGRKPGEGWHGLSKAKGFVEDYISRRIDHEADTLEENMLNRLSELSDDKNILPSLKKWFRERRTGNLKNVKKNALDLYKDYVSSVSKALFFDEILQQAEDSLPKLQPAMKEMMYDWISRLLGYPTKETFATTSLINRGLELADNYLPKGMKPIRITDHQATMAVQKLMDFAYIRHMGLRPKSGLKNLLQTFNNTLPELGYRWTGAGLADMLSRGKNAFKEAEENGVLREFAPQLFRELEGMTNKDSLAIVRDLAMFQFSFADRINRCIAYYGSLRKFDYYLRTFTHNKDIDKFLKKLELNHMHPRYREDVARLMKEGKTEEARQVYAKKITGDTQYLYGKQDAPLVTADPLGKAAFQYSSWPINYAELLIDDVKYVHWQSMLRRTVLYGAIATALKYGSKKMDENLNYYLKTLGLGPFEGKLRYDIVPPAFQPIEEMIETYGYPLYRSGKEHKLTTKGWKKKLKKKEYGWKAVEPLIIKDLREGKVLK